MCFPSFQRFFGEALENGGGGGSDAHSHQVFFIKYTNFLQVCRGCIPFAFSSNKEWQLCCFFLFSTFFHFPRLQRYNFKHTSAFLGVSK